MTRYAIRVANLGKLYHIGARQRNAHKDLRDVLADSLLAPVRRGYKLLTGRAQSAAALEEKFWALRDIAFDVEQGEVVGIIGHNGAGKSTLLKILSRITEPTTGRIALRGRVSSLLEVGTGFHPELTGRENIYLNGSILGMRRAEINRKLDEIVDFAGVEKFIDTPVKHYSSGMYLRLAFSVAAHLEPEILLVDEVLAVGDAAFQRKCLGKMESVARAGRTVLFVSHNMAAVSALCSRAILLERGKIRETGSVDQIINLYQSFLHTISQTPLSQRTDRGGDGRVRITHVCTLDENDQPLEAVRSGQDIKFVISYQAQDLSSDLRNVNVAIGIYNSLGGFVLFCSNEMTGVHFQKLPPVGKVTCVIPHLLLTPGVYPFNLSFHANGIMADWVREASVLQVIEGDYFGTGRLPEATHGGVLTAQHWRFEDR